MLCLWFVIACLAAAANADLADFIKTKLASNPVFNSPITVDGVHVPKGAIGAAKVADGTVTYTNLQVDVLSQTATELVFTVSGDATCKYDKYGIMKDNIKMMIDWTSFSSRDKNRFKVKMDVSNCIGSNTPEVKVAFIEGIQTCAACSDRYPAELKKWNGGGQMLVDTLGSFIRYVVAVKISSTIKTAAGSLDLKGSGFAGC